MKHRELIDPRNYVYSIQHTDAYWDIPDGDHELRIDIRADRPFNLYLRCGDDLTECLIPLGTKDHHQHQMRVRDCKALYAQFTDTTNVAAQIRQKTIRVAEKPWGDPIVVTVDPDEPTDIRALIAREMAYLRDDTSKDDPHEFHGLDQEEYDDIHHDADEDFGEGLMEPPDDITESMYSQRMQHRSRNRRMGRENSDAPSNIQNEQDTATWTDDDNDPDANTDAAPTEIGIVKNIKKLVERY